MIIKIKFNRNRIILFGDSYKPWQEQLKEYCNLFKVFTYEEAWVSNQSWIKIGGLKWCCLEDFSILLKKREQRIFMNFNFKPISKNIIIHS